MASQGPERRPAAQFARYTAFGILAGCVDMAAFYAAAIFLLPALSDSDPIVRLLGMRMPPMSPDLRSSRYIWDKAIAFVFSTATGYATSVLWIFTPGRHGRVFELLLFTAFTAASVGAGTVLAWLLIHEAGMHTTYAYAANVAAAAAINYVARKYLVFKD